MRAKEPASSRGSRIRDADVVRQARYLVVARKVRLWRRRAGAPELGTFYILYFFFFLLLSCLVFFSLPPLPLMSRTPFCSFALLFSPLLPSCQERAAREPRTFHEAGAMAAARVDKWIIY